MPQFSNSLPSTVLIAGAGPSGLVAALTLLKNGIPVRIIDKETKHRIGQRGAAIAPRSLELYHFLGVHEIEENANPAPMVQTYHPGGIEPLETLPMTKDTEPTPAYPYFDFALLGQDRAESHLHSHLSKYSCFVEFGTELRSLTQHPDYVEAVLVKQQGDQEILEISRVSWLIGADGARGVVRKQIGVTFLGETRNEEGMLTGDLRITGLDHKYWHIWGNLSSNLVALRATPDFAEDGFALFASGRNLDSQKMASRNDLLVEYLKSVTERNDLKVDVRWASDFRPNIRMANKFRERRVFISGDAAHIHSPTGGQGMNSSIQDTFNLGWKLALVIKGLSPPSLLDTYSEERVPVIAKMLKLTTNLLDDTTKADRSNTGSSFKRDHSTFQLGVNYRGSRILVDDQHTVTSRLDPYRLVTAGSICAGDRAPDSPGLVSAIARNEQSTRLFDIFKPWYHTVLIFATASSDVATLIPELKQYPSDFIRPAVLYPQDSVQPTPLDGIDLQFIDSEGHAFKWYSIPKEGGRVVVVRPDGVVGAIANGMDGLHRYFKLIFL